MIVRILFGTLIYLLLSSSAAFACFCLPSPECPRLGGESGPVFVGTVLQVTDLPGSRNGAAAFLSSRKVRLQVNESFGGLAPDAREIDVLTGLGGGDCGVPFKLGEKYLVAASRSDDGQVRASICGHTRRIDAAGAAIRMLRQQRDGQAAPALAGRIAQSDCDFNGTLGTYAPKPLANALVRVKSKTGSFETQADAEGLYAFYGLPPGRYEFAPDLPLGTTLSWYIGSDEP